MSDPGSEVFYEACLPCASHVAQVLDPDARGLHRVVVGLFADRAAARRARDSLPAAGFDGFVCAL